MDWINEATWTLKESLKKSSNSIDIHSREFIVEIGNGEYQILNEAFVTPDNKLARLSFGDTQFSREEGKVMFSLTANEKLVRDSTGNFHKAFGLDIVTNRSDSDKMQNLDLLIVKSHPRRGHTYYHPVFKAGPFLVNMVNLFEEGRFTVATGLIASSWSPEVDYMADNFYMFVGAYESLGSIDEFKGKNNHDKRLKEAAGRTWTGKALGRLGYIPIDVRIERAVSLRRQINFAQAIFAKADEA